MRKIVTYLIWLLPIISFGYNPPAPGLEDPPAAASIDQIDMVLFFTALFLGIYFHFRKPVKRNPKKIKNLGNLFVKH